MDDVRTTEAWVLTAGQGRRPEPATLRLAEVPLGTLGADDALVEPIYGCWEANMSHALSRRPLDVARTRGEDAVVLGNCGLVRVLELGDDVTHLRVGELCIIGNGGRYDRFGYPEQVWGYDWPGSMGFLARRSRVTASILLPIPTDSRFTPRQWAAFGVRYATAYDNWQVAHACWRTQLSEADQPRAHVWGWGGGTSLGGAHLAAVLGHRAVLTTSSDRRRAQVEALGIEVVDRRAYPDLCCDERAFATDAAYREAFARSDDAFHARVQELTDGLGASIFFDFLGSPLIRTTLRSLGRQGVLTTAGWKEGMQITSMRALECIRRHLHVHTHYARRDRIAEAMAFAERTGWMNPVADDEPIWAFEDVPALAAAYARDEVDAYFPIYQVNPL